MAFRITKKEIQSRSGYVFLGLFAGIMVDPIQNYLEANFNINPIVLGIIGIALVLYIWDFGK